MCNLHGANDLFDVEYDELRAIAHRFMRHERADHTLDATAAVNQAYLKLCALPNKRWESRAHFLGAAARAMRQILVDHARQHHAEKRGGGAGRITLSDTLGIAGPADAIEVLALDEALHDLARRSPRQARVVELRFFGGLDVGETAAALGVGERTVKADWRVARAWLRNRLAE